MKCPYCGFPIVTSGDWKRKEMHTFSLGDEIAVAAGARYTRRRPARSATFQSDVAVPFVQAFVTSVGVGLLAGILRAIADYADSIQYALTWCTGLFAASWLILLVSHHFSLWDRETITNGAPEEGKMTTTIEVSITDGKRKQFINLDVDVPPEKMIEFAKGVQRGKPLTEREWTGAGRLFSGTELTDLRDALMARGLAKWKNPHHRKQGWLLTGRGEKVMRQLAQERGTQ